jgi:hypothetical protein
VKRAELLRALVDRVYPIVREEYRDPACCVPASYHARDVLRARGIPARLAAFDVIAGNSAWWEFMAAKPENPRDFPEGAWSVGLTHNNPSPAPGHNLHLCVVSKGAIVDCSIGQMSRPARGLTLPPGLLVPRAARGLWSGDGVAVHYRPSPLPVPPNWRNDPEAAARVRRRLASLFGNGGRS